MHMGLYLNDNVIGSAIMKLVFIALALGECFTFFFSFFSWSVKTLDESITLNLFLTDTVYNMCGMAFMT